MLLTRRTLLATTPALLAVAPDPIAAIERAHGGRLGVFAVDTGSGAVLAHRADERFLLASTFKGPLAAFVMSRIDAGQDRPEAALHLTTKDLLPGSPISTAQAPSGTITLAQACQAILERSDNTAANLLLAHVGGPAVLTAYLRTLGDATTSVNRYELVGGWSGTQDTTTPRAIVGLTRTILLGGALKPKSRDTLERWMAGNVAGRTRLRAAFPHDWAVADRTGTADGICNDFAVVRPPSRAAIVIATYHDAPDLQLEQQEAVLRAVGSAILAWHS